MENPTKPTEAQVRKGQPVATGLVAYFPDALDRLFSQPSVTGALSSRVASALAGGERELAELAARSLDLLEAELGNAGAPRSIDPVLRWPAACRAVAECSRLANEQHNPGMPMHWAFGKSADHFDCLLRHYQDAGTVDSDGVRHSAKVAWRALAALQTYLENKSPDLHEKRQNLRARQASGGVLATPKPEPEPKPKPEPKPTLMVGDRVSFKHGVTDEVFAGRVVKTSASVGRYFVECYDRNPAGKRFAGAVGFEDLPEAGGYRELTKI